MSAELQIKADSTLATSQLLKSYSAFVLAQHKSIQRDIDSADKRLKMIEIATDMVQDHISSVCDYVSEENQSVEDTTNSDIQADNSKTAIQYIPSYLGYALKENSTCDLEEEFQKSMICKIITGGKDIAVLGCGCPQAGSHLRYHPRFHFADFCRQRSCDQMVSERKRR